MFKNYIKIAWRTIKKNKVYSLINIIGLTIGLWVCMSVATVVLDDLSYDSFWPHKDELYRIVSVQKKSDGSEEKIAASFMGLGAALIDNFPEVEDVARIIPTEKDFDLYEKNNGGVKVDMLNVSQATLDVLDIKILAGNPKNYVEGSSNIIISKSFKDKYFPDENPVGKIIYDVPQLEDHKNPFLITGVMQDLPENTHLRAEMIHFTKNYGDALRKEGYGTFTTHYVLMKPGTDIPQFTKKVNAWYTDFVEAKNPFQFEFQPIEDIYLHSDFNPSQKVQGNLSTIYILSEVALLLLLIACINFINLSTARAISRLREIGVRKILGAKRRQVIYQFLTEAVLFFMIATFLSLFLYQFSLAPIENYIGHGLAETFTSKAYLFVIILGLILLTSLLTGIYPAWILSGFKPATTLKGKLFGGMATGQNFVRKSLVVLQFSISIVVLVALIIVQQQVSFMKDKDIGFDKHNLLNIGFISWGDTGNSFKNELLDQNGVIAASSTLWLPGEAGRYSKMVDDPQNPEHQIKVWYIKADTDLAKTLGLKLQKGRLLDKSFPSDVIYQKKLWAMNEKDAEATEQQRASMITESTAKILGVKTLNKNLKNAGTTPVGIVEDFNTESLQNPKQPTIIIAEKSEFGNMLVRITPGTEKQVLGSIHSLWKKFYPNKLLNIKWVDDMLNKQYEKESKLQQLFAFFSGLSMFLAALGIFGLIVLATFERIKEIGIRKVLGASIGSITVLFSKDILKLVVLAIIVACPIAWYLMHNWLQDFAYRIDIQWWVFALAGMAAISIALITVGIQAVKAAMANPVDSLRTE